MAKKNEKKQVTSVKDVDNAIQSSNYVSKVWDGVQYVSVEGLTYEELVQRDNSIRETLRANTSEVSYKVGLYRKSLIGTLSDIEKLYNGVASVFDGMDSVSVKANIDSLSRITGVKVSDLFDVKFVGGLYDTYTFTVLNDEPNRVQTLKAVKRKVSDKTDYNVLADRTEKVLGFRVDIEASEFMEKDKAYYWLPVTNFTVSNIFKTVFSLNKDSLLRISLQVLKAQKRANKRLEKKEKKKALKAGENISAEAGK